MNKKIIVLAIVGLLVLGLAGTTYAVNGSLSAVLNKAGETLGQLIFGKMENQINNVSVNTEDFIGAASTVGTTQSTKKIAQVAMDNTTTTVGSLYNNSGQDRIITAWYMYYEHSQNDKAYDRAVPPNFNLQASTSSNAYNTSTTMFLVNWKAGAAVGEAGLSTTTTATPGKFFVNASSTPVEMTSNIARLWKNGERLNFNISPTNTHSTSTGIVGVEYVVQ